jgi:membrane associated rhomboid family serine protease
VHAPRPPHMSPGTQAFIWALVFAIYVWAFMVGVGNSNAVAALVGALVGGAVFLLVRLYGEDLTRRRVRRTKP